MLTIIVLAWTMLFCTLVGIGLGIFIFEILDEKYNLIYEYMWAPILFIIIEFLCVSGFGIIPPLIAYWLGYIQ